MAVDLSIEFCQGDTDASGIYAGGSLITGAHAILYSTEAKADRAFLRELLGTPSVDAGDGWLISHFRRLRSLSIQWTGPQATSST